MPIFYAGLNASPLLCNQYGIIPVIDQFTEIPFEGLTALDIGWNYFLLQRGTNLYISGKTDIDGQGQPPLLLQIPDDSSRFKQAIAGKENVTILSATNEIWQYKVYEKSWRKVRNFIPTNDSSETEYPQKISQGRCTVALTNLGRVFNIPILVEMPKRVKFIDVACGFDHTVMLAENGNVYSMGMGTRGQLGHGDLEDCDNPRLVEALAGINVVQISAAGWHSAVITDQGDLYIWGWNTNGQLGIVAEDTKISATPTVVDFKNAAGEDFDVNVKMVRCGNAFTICMLEDGTLWGCGSNKYGQMGQSRKELTESKLFIKLVLNLSQVKNVKCQEWGTLITTD